MLGWRTLSFEQRALLLGSIAFFGWMFILVGAPADRSMGGWLRYTGGVLIVVGALLNPQSVGGTVTDPIVRSWPAFPLAVLAVGVIATLTGFALRALTSL